jgi:hypothetical protein
MDWTGKKFLDQFVDEALEVDMGWTPLAEKVRQVERLAPAIAVMELVRDHPGRIPESSGREVRRADKLNAKRVQSRLLSQLRRWDGNEEEIQRYKEDPEVKRQAAQLQWPQWWVDHKTRLTACMRHIATHAKATANARQGNAMVNNLSNEYRTLDEVLGNLPTTTLE